MCGRVRAPKESPIVTVGLSSFGNTSAMRKSPEAPATVKGSKLGLRRQAIYMLLRVGSKTRFEPLGEAYRIVNEPRY